ncbi:hypothetical protein ACFL56_03715, partial [Candidatus Margulisiibacteriota bacterium]
DINAEIDENDPEFTPIPQDNEIHYDNFKSIVFNKNGGWLLYKLTSKQIEEYKKKYQLKGE